MDASKEPEAQQAAAVCSCFSKTQYIDDKAFARLLNTADFLGIDLIIDTLIKQFCLRCINKPDEFFFARQQPELYTGPEELNPDLVEKLRRSLLHSADSKIATFVHAQTIENVGHVTALAFHPKKGLLVTGLISGLMQLWKIDPAKPAASYLLQAIARPQDGDFSSVSTLAFHPTKDLLVSGSINGTVRLCKIDPTTLNASVFQIIQSYSNSNLNKVNTLVFHPNNDLLISGWSDATICLRKIHPTVVPYSSPLQTIDTAQLGHKSSISTLAAHPTKDFFASGSDAGLVSLWKIDPTTLTASLLRTLSQFETTQIHSLSIHPEDFLIFGSRNRGNQMIQLWKIDTRTGDFFHPTICTRPQKGSPPTISTIAYCPTKELLVSGSDDGTISLWKIDPKTVSASYIQTIGHTQNGHSPIVCALALHPTGSLLASGLNNGTIKLCNDLTKEKTHFEREASFAQALLLAIAAKKQLGAGTIGGGFGRGAFLAPEATPIDVAAHPNLKNLYDSFDEGALEGHNIKDLVKLLVYQSSDTATNCS